MKAYGALLALALAASAMPALAADKSAPKVVVTAKPKMVCFADAETGSHIRKRTCVTEAEYEARKKRDQEAAANMRGKVKPNSTRNQ